MTSRWSSRAILISLISFVSAAALACGTDEPDVWADLSGTIYALSPPSVGSVVALDPASGRWRIVSGAPGRVVGFTAARSGAFLVLGLGELFRFDVATGALSPIEADGFTSLQPAVSPDEQRVAYSRSLPEGYAIAIANVGGTGFVDILGPEPEPLYQIGWLTDSTLAFARTDSTLGLNRAWSIGADGQGLTPIGGDTGIVVTGLAPSQSGEALAVGHWVQLGTGPIEPWLATPRGELVRRIAQVSEIDASQLAWSPDDRYLVTCTGGASGLYDLTIIHVESGDTRTFETPTANECSPAWTDQ